MSIGGYNINLIGGGDLECMNIKLKAMVGV